MDRKEYPITSSYFQGLKGLGMPFKIRIGDEVLNSGENLVGIVMEEYSDSYLVNITTEDMSKVWHKTDATGWRQTKFNKTIESSDKKAAEKSHKSQAKSTPILYRKVPKRRDN